ncbi:MAG: tRNA uridine-5-carboxymethylaminomethyl(34) synthesis GTPase MnmE [Magnetococcales bacterium]|nr:tRNA uridine-5-carboxymethylaminomethyl(34) synthesis GTPase MnmE [Magnetococcales bacterium]
MGLSPPIAALATPPGKSGVAVVRTSGRGILHQVLPLLRSPGGRPVGGEDFPPRQLQRMDLVEGVGGPVLDQALVVFFPGPASFTGEDQVEFHCHGSPVVVTRLLELLTLQGIAPAGPGEFSRRAFLNGKMDLVRAEAVMELIQAASLRGARVAARHMGGGLSRSFGEIKQALVLLLAHLEAHLDFPDEELDPRDESALLQGVLDLTARLTDLGGNARLGQLLHDGFELAIVGRPNVGKSSLFNLLVQEDAAIVTPHPGTTRDLNLRTLQIDGIPVRLVDTAGLRRAAGVVEQEGIRRARGKLGEADGILVVLEAHRGVLAEDLEILAALGKVDFLLVWNKGDLRDAAFPLPDLPPLVQSPMATLVTSCATGGGLPQLVQAIARLLGSRDGGGEGDAILVARQRAVLERAQSALMECGGLLQQGRPLELVALPLREAVTALGELTGEVTHADLLDTIFSTFCIGK